MVWIRRYIPEEAHACMTPEQKHGGDIWACDSCGKVYLAGVVYRDGEHFIYWYRANWWQQRKYHPRYECGCKIGDHRKCKARAGVMHGILKATKWERSPDDPLS